MSSRERSNFPEKTGQFSEMIDLNPANAYVVNSEFIIRTNFGANRRMKGYTANFSVFTFPDTKIIKEGKNSKNGAVSTHKKEPTITNLSLNKREPRILIDSTQILFVEKELKKMRLKISSSDPLQLEEIDYYINDEDALRILKDLPTAKIEDQRKKFEQQRALEHYKMGKATMVERVFLKKKGLI